MSDFAQFPRPVKGCRAEYGSGKTRLIVDACQLSDDLYEVITMRPAARRLNWCEWRPRPRRARCMPRW